MSTAPPTQVTIRRSTSEDLAEIARLATIDSAPVPTGSLLLAEVDGELRAALAVDDGRVIADPFSPSLAIVALLREHGRLFAGECRSRRRLARFGSSRRDLHGLDR